MTTTLRIFASMGMLFVLISAAQADQTVFSNSGGTVTMGSDLIISGSSVSSPAGSLSVDCPLTSITPTKPYTAEWTCVGGSMTLQSSDGSTSLSAAFTSGLFTEQVIPAGHGNPTTYLYVFSGYYRGTLIRGTAQEAVAGEALETLAPATSPLGTGTIQTGSVAANSDYEPVYVADTYNDRIVRMDDMFGANWISLGTQGSGTNQFTQPWGVFVDAAGKIYVSDSNNCRIVQMSDMLGTNWTTIGSRGSGVNQFSVPTGIFVDAAGKIYVADAANSRVVRMDDITGTNWISYGTNGSGTGQFNLPTGIAVDASGRIYVADADNDRIVRMDDMTGTNWTAFGSLGGGTGFFNLPSEVRLDSTGRIYVADTLNNRITRMDDMNGTNFVALGGLGSGTDQFMNPYGMFVDGFGTIYVADSQNNRVAQMDDMTGLGFTGFGKTGAHVNQFSGPFGIFAAPITVPTADAVLSASSVKFPDQVKGTTSAAQTVTVTNIGSAPLSVNHVGTKGNFAETNTCTGTLPAGQSCTASVTFTPSATGRLTGSMTFGFGTAGALSVGLSGTGTLVEVSPLTLAFGNVKTGTTSTMAVTVSNPGAASAAIRSVRLTAAKPYTMTNTCGKSLAAGASCAVNVKFAPKAAQSEKGHLIVTDGAGIAQKVTISGTGTK